MSLMRFLQNVRPHGLLTRGLTTLQTAEEALAFETETLRLQLTNLEAAPKELTDEADLSPSEEEEDSAVEERQHQKRRDAQAKRETQELLLLQDLLPYLLQNDGVLEAEGAVCCFIDRNPRNANGFVLLADVYSHQNDLAAACECLWGAIYNSPGNRTLLRLLRNSEEQFLLRQCQLPLSFLVKSLQTQSDSKDESDRGFVHMFESMFLAEGAPVVVVRQGKNVAAFANKDLQPGDVVFRQKPFVLTPLVSESGHIYTSCFHCLQEREDPGRGFSCPVSPHTCPFVFCSWECLVRNCRIHALECQAIPMLLAAARESKLSATSVIHIFRTIAKTGLERQFREDQADADSSGEATTDVIEQLLKLNSYRVAVARGQPELFRQLTTLARRLQQAFPAKLLLFLSERDLIDLMLVLWQYSPFLTSPSVPSAVERRNPDGAVGQVLAPAVALLHHSCVPTCGLSLQEDGLVAVRALTFIPAGGSLCVSLEEDLFRSQRDRKGLTALPRVFGCGCLRCTDSAEGGRRLRGIRCFSCLRGFLCPHKSTALSSRLSAYSVGRAAVSEFSSGGQLVERLKPFDAKLADMLSLKKHGLAAPQNKVNSETMCGGTLQQEKEVVLEEEWLCTCCGLGSAAVSQSCAQLEAAVERKQALAEKALFTGALLKARQEYTELVNLYSSRLHPQHAVLFNSHTVLAGLLASHPARDPLQALVYIRRAALAAETVLPPSSRLKMDLYLKLANCTYDVMQLDRHCRRGPSLPEEFIMGPMYTALWNCCVCFGSDSSLAIVVQQTLRRYAALLGVCTPPLLHRPVLRTVDLFVGLYREVTGSRADSDQVIADHFSRDPMFLAVALVRRGVCFPLALEMFMAMKDIPHLPTGLTLLGLACAHKQVQIVRVLLKMGFDMFHRTALGITALLAMCAGTKAHTEFPGNSVSTALQAVENVNALEDSACREAATLRLLLQRCDELDSQEPQRPEFLLEVSHTSRGRSQSNKPSEKIKGILRNERASVEGGSDRVSSYRNRLLTACTHKLLGQSSALHFAASNGKARLCRQLLASGSFVVTLNAESATALHLACASGDLATVRVLLDHGALVDSTTLRGETPLMMAAYNLHEEVCVLLLERKADPAVVARVEGFSVLHALAAGVTRQVSTRFRGLSWEGHRPATALLGLSEESEELGVYTKANTYISEESLVDVRLPSASPVSTEIFLSPATMLKRTAKAREVLFVLMKHCHISLYKQQSRRGLSPAELLSRMWDAFVTKRERILQISDLQLEGLTEEERLSFEEGWEFVRHQIFLIRKMLEPEFSRLSREPSRSQYVDTPRQDDLRQREKERLISEAPWLFPELIQRAVPTSAAPTSEPVYHRRPAIARGPKTEPSVAPGIRPKVAVVGTGIQFLPDSKDVVELPPQQMEHLAKGAAVPSAAPEQQGKAPQDSTWVPPVPKGPPNEAPPPKPLGASTSTKKVAASPKQVPPPGKHPSPNAIGSPTLPTGPSMVAAPLTGQGPPAPGKPFPPKSVKGPPPQAKKAKLPAGPL